jgi:hypothetical protein
VSTPTIHVLQEKKDRNEMYAICREGLKKTNLVITEDSR